QRVVAEILAYVTGPDVGRHSLPAAAWVRRQWLGLDPPGPLFQIRIDGVPAFFAVSAAARAGEAQACALLESLPVPTRIALLGEIELTKMVWSPTRLPV